MARILLRTEVEAKNPGSVFVSDWFRVAHLVGDEEGDDHVHRPVVATPFLQFGGAERKCVALFS